VEGDLVAAVLPYLTTLATAYGTAVLDQVRNEAADATTEATVGAGRRLLRRLRAGPVGEAVVKVGAEPGNPHRVTVLRMQLQDAFAADPEMAAEFTTLLTQAPPLTASGPRAVVVGNNEGIVQTGDGSSAWQQR